MTRRRNIEDPEQPTPSRRAFFWKGACAALTATGIANTIWDLRNINAAAAATLPRALPVASPRKGRGGSITARGGQNPNYKALVCIFLFGGNDANNLLVPTDTTTYNQYSTARGVLALPLPGQTGGLLPLNPLNNSDGHTYGLHPGTTELANLFNSGKLAILRNCGTLLAPLTRAQYLAKSVATPPQLFSHSDQQIEWQTMPDQPAKTGWGGRTADLLYSLNSNNNVSMNISVAGSNTYEVGNTINEYNVSTSGAISLNIPGSGSGPAQLQAMKDIIALNHTNLYESAFATDANTAIQNAATLNAAINATASSSYWTTPFPTTSLGNQLKMIARLIQAAPTLGHNRQIFFASMGGYDLHSTEVASGNPSGGAHAGLLADLSKCMNALYQATVQLGIDASVTQFTASDFSRTFPVNAGQGSDHAWGSHHMILGGSVVGQTLYGTFPTLAVNGPDDTSTGRWIPTTSVDEYSATLARWFGVSDANLPVVFPNLGRFANPNLGFLG